MRKNLRSPHTSVRLATDSGYAAPVSATLLPPARTALTALFLLVSSAIGCADAAVPRAGSTPGAPRPAGPELLPAGMTAPASSLPLASPGAATGASGAPAPEAVGFDPARIVRVLDDPRLADIRAAIEREAHKKAADDLEARISDPAKTSGAGAFTPEEIRSFRYQVGELRALAGDPLGAAKAYDAAAAAGGPIADYARFAAADLLEKAGEHDAALERARAIPQGLPIAKELELIMAAALAGKGDVEAASVLWRSYLARQQHPPQWVNVSLRFARALLRKPTEERAEEAIRLARRVLFEAPKGEGSGEAKAIESEALSVLPFARRKAFESPAAGDLLARAKALLAAQQSREALAALDALAALPEGKGPGEIACEAAITRADALGKLRRKAESSDAFGDAIDRCAGMSRRAEALYGAGRSSEKASRAAEAMQRFALLEAEFPKHRLADDARYRGAKAALEIGDEARFTRMLSEMPDAYPEGDMVNDGLFELALARIEKRDWAGAVVPLERALARAPRERAYYAAGRLPYYLGRARIETGSVDKGVELLASVIRTYPLSYYMALAHARLSERDPAAAKAAIDAAIAREPEGVFILPKSPAFETPAFLRAVELARQGEGRLARGELDQLGLGARTAPPEVLWASVFLLDRAGAPGLSHSILRAATMQSVPSKAQLIDWLDHYPVGRWRAAWEAAYPKPFGAIVAAESKRQQIPEALALAIMREESAFDPRVVSHAAAVGLMQLIVPTAKNVAKPLNLPWDAEALKRPAVNIALGCRFLSILRGKFPDNPAMAIPSYNAGAGAPRRWIAARPTQDFDVWVERIPYEETRLYTKRVLTSMAAYEFLYAKDQVSEVFRTPLAASSSAAAAAASAPLASAARPEAASGKSGDAEAAGAAGASEPGSPAGAAPAAAPDDAPP
jgi:soluble lytic murein transglycosylase